jgi:hypothetical protein
MSGGRVERRAAPEGFAPREPDRVPAAGVTHLGHHPVEAGKPKMAAVGACLRKLLMIAYGALKSRTPLDPARGSKMTP